MAAITVLMVARETLDVEVLSVVVVLEANWMLGLCKT
jgi:hypothetical protein